MMKFYLFLFLSFCLDFVVSQNLCTNENMGECIVDGFVGTNIIYDDPDIRMWNFTLAPGQITSMHRHDCDYHFVAIEPTELEVYGETGELLFSFIAQGTLGFHIEGDELVQIKTTEFDDSLKEFVPIRAPRVHAAKNIGNKPYYEILFESKTKCV